MSSISTTALYDTYGQSRDIGVRKYIMARRYVNVYVHIHFFHTTQQELYKCLCLVLQV